MTMNVPRLPVRPPAGRDGHLDTEPDRGAATAAPRRKRKPKEEAMRARRIRLGVGTVVALILLWQLASRTGVLPPEVPPPSQVAGWFGANADSGAFWGAVGATLLQWALGVLVGVALGSATGFLIALVPVLERLIRLPLEFIRPIPSVVYLPVLLLVVGASTRTSVIVIAVGVYFPMMFQTLYGLRGADPVTLDTARVYGLHGWQRLVWVRFPAALPSIATGIRLSSSVALVIAMAVQLTAPVPGLGRLLTTYQGNAVYEGIYGIVLTSGILGFVLVWLIQWVEHRVLRWHEPYRPGATA
jgi:ABC-type nitrate/sulfonate/bicarbonate transport system permease component